MDFHWVKSLKIQSLTQPILTDTAGKTVPNASQVLNKCNSGRAHRKEPISLGEFQVGSVIYIHIHPSSCIHKFTDGWGSRMVATTRKKWPGNFSPNCKFFATQLTTAFYSLPSGIVPSGRPLSPGLSFLVWLETLLVGFFLSTTLEGLLVKISGSCRVGQALKEGMWPWRKNRVESRGTLPLEQERWQGLPRRGQGIRRGSLPPPPSPHHHSSPFSPGKRGHPRLWEVHPNIVGSRGQMASRH